MSNFLIFKAAFNNSATPAIGTYTVEGGAAQFKINTSLSPNYYMYAATAENPIKWFVPTAVVTDFEFVCDILTRDSNFGYAPYFTIADSNGVTKLRMESQYSNIRFMSDDTHGQSSSVICLTSPTDIGGYDIFHQFRIRIRKLTDSSSSVEVYANGNLVTSGTSPALITCGKISFLGATGAFVTDNIGVKNAYVYDLSGGEVIDRSTLSNAFTRFIGWAKGIFALKSDIPTVNDATLTIQKNGTDIGTFSANSSSDKTVNITVPTATSELTNDSGYITGVAWNDVSNKPTFATVATSGSYNDLSNKPTIPTVNDATLTIQKNGTTIDTFTANSSTDKTVNISVPTNTSELTNGAGFITADYAIPRSGGAVITGTSLGRTTNTDTFEICAGTDSNNGGNILLYGNAYSSSTYQGAIGFYALTSPSSYKAMFLFADGTWTWEGTACQITSDQRLKQQIGQIDDKLLDAWEDVELCQFKYNDAVDQKKDKARLHTGYVVQQIDKACKEHGVDVSAYGLYCHEEYPQETEEVEIEQADGTKTKERKVIREASEHYSLRYTEALIVECKYLRRCIERLTARIEELEKGKEAEK